MDYVELLREAFTKPVVAERPLGAARIFVAISDPAQAKAIAKAARKLGKVFQKKTCYGDSNAIYIGYDNFDGRDLARGTAVVQALQSAGIASYRVENGD